MFSFVTCFQNNSGFVYCILNSLNGYKNQNTQCSDLLPTMSLSKSSIRTPSSWCVSSFMSTNLRNSLLFSWFIISIILPSCDLDKIVDASFCETNWKIGMLHFLLFIWSLPYLSLFSWTSANVSANPPVPWRNSQTNETTEDTSVIKSM